MLFKTELFHHGITLDRDMNKPISEMFLELNETKNYNASGTATMLRCLDGNRLLRHKNMV